MLRWQSREMKMSYQREIWLWHHYPCDWLAYRSLQIFKEREEDLKRLSRPLACTCFRTSIWDETLYKVVNQTGRLLKYNMFIMLARQCNKPLLSIFLGMVQHCVPADPQCTAAWDEFKTFCTNHRGGWSSSVWESHFSGKSKQLSLHNSGSTRNMFVFVWFGEWDRWNFTSGSHVHFQSHSSISISSSTSCGLTVAPVWILSSW